MTSEIGQIAQDVAVEEIEAFIVSSRKRAWELAWRITRDQVLAEEAITQTYRELWRGDTAIAFFFRALKMNARDVLVLRNLERDRFKSIDTAQFPRSSARSELLRDLEVEPDQADFASNRMDDQDPLDILVQREDQQSRDRLLAEALELAENSRRYWWIRQKKWGRELGIGQPSQAVLSTK